MKQDIKEIFSRMTLEEKASLCSGRDVWNLKGVERLGIPSVMVSDGPHGLRKQNAEADHLGLNESIEAVCFPAGCATACSFDEDLLEQVGTALGEECRSEGICVLLGPAVNIKRSPLCGRNFEYFSEDPYLAGKLAAAQIRGVQSWDVGTSIKHFAANNQEYRRMSISSNMSERTFREIYLPPFEAAVKEAAPWTVMCSYNKINGVYASENRRLLTEILRDEWGFDGFVVSDWGAVNERVPALEAGLDLEMPGPCADNDEKIVAAVRAGQLDEAILDRAVTRILTQVFRYTEAPDRQANFDRALHHGIAAKLEEECAVLLKNDGLLPLNREQKIVYIGEFARIPRYQGGGSSHINASRVTSALDCAGGNVTYENGFPSDADELDPENLAAAVRAAAEADVAVIFAGLPDIFESEGYDRVHMSLPNCQNELIRQVCAVQKNTVVVLHCGSPVETPWAEETAAVLCMYLGGEGVGEATDALLYGEAVPCGRLAETWPLKLEDNPSYLNFHDDPRQAEYAEGIYVGYRYYDKKNMAVRWPFGHGESYTSFSYGNARLSSSHMRSGESIRFLVDITNTGSVAAKEVVQLYVADRTGNRSRPVRELKGFAKVALAPQESKTVSFTIDERSLSYYSEDIKDWYAAPGTYELCAAHSSRDIRASAVLTFETDRELPFLVTRNTTMGELMADKRTAPTIQALLARAKNGLSGLQPENDPRKAAISAEMTRQMIINAPLRTVQSFMHLSDQTMDEMIATLNEKIGAKNPTEHTR